jgi:hypothetical protein
MKTEIIFKKTNNGEFVEVLKVWPEFPEPSYSQVLTERGYLLHQGNAEEALRILARNMV